MVTRIISALIGLFIFLAFCFGGELTFAIGVTLVAALGTLEFITAHRRAPVPVTAANCIAVHLPQGDLAIPLLPDPRLNPAVAFIGVAFPMLAYTDPLHHPLGRFLSAVTLGLLVALFATLLVHAARTGRTIGRMRPYYGLIGAAYIGALFSGFIFLRDLHGRIVVPPFPEADRGAWIMLFVCFCVWATDTFAYFVGRSLGRHKLAPALSPKKTIEGSLGGLAGGMLMGAAFGTWIHLPLQHGLAIGAIAGVVGQLGDLFESAMKRELGVKDFGNLMPGHGGILDRFDSLLFVVPLAYLYLRLFANQ